MADTIQSLDDKIKALQNRQAELTARNTYLDAQIKVEQQSYNDWAAKGKWDEAHRHSDAVNSMDAERTGNKAELASISETLPLLLAQKKTQVDAQNALVAQANAAAAVTNSHAQLTADQQFQLQMAQQQAQATNTANQQRDAQLQADADKANTKTYWIIGGIAAFVVTVVGIIWMVKKRG